jgi:DNA-binding CsgD family transcriptional regulator
VSHLGAPDPHDLNERAFVGRVDEIGVLSRSTELARTGHAQTVWVEGEAGCGKSALLTRWLNDLPEDVQFLRAEADELAGDVPLELVGQLGDFDAKDGFGVGMQILDLVDRAQNAGPVVVVIEDLHWADLASRQALLTVARRLRNDSSLIVLTSRPVFRDDGWDRFTSEADRCTRINLGALDIQEVGELARICGMPLNSQSVERLHEHTLGHALYVRTLLSELSIDQLSSSGGGLPAPRSLAWTTVARMAETDPAAQMLGSAMAVLNRRLPLHAVAEIADVSDATDALEALLGTGFVTWSPNEVGTPVEYRHPLYRAAVYDDLSPGLRHTLHVAAANALDPADALPHRVAATDIADITLVDDLISQAGAAESRSEFGQAATYWLSVSQVSVSHRQDLMEPATLHAARLLLADGQLHGAQALQGPVESTPTSPLRSLLLGRLAWEGGDAVLAEFYFDDVCELTGGNVASDPLRVEALVRLAMMYVIENRGVEAHAAATEALRHAPLDPTLEIRAWSELVRAEGMLRGAAAGLALLEDRLRGQGSTIGPRDADLLLTRGILGFYAGRNVEATADFRNVIRLVRHGAVTAELPRVHLQLAQLLIIRGDWDEAVMQARLGLSLVDDGGQIWIEAQAHAAMASVMASRGEWTTAEAHAKSARAVADIVGTSEALFTAHIAESALARARGDAAGVVGSLAPLAGKGDSETMTMLTSLGWWSVLIHALIDVDDLGRAQRQLTQLRTAASDRSIDVEARILGLQARISSASGDPDQAAGEFTRSLALFGADDAILDRASVHHSFGRLLHARGRRQLAIEQLRFAHDIYRGVEAQPYLQRVEAELNEIGISERAPSSRSALSLTEREQDVVALVAKGMTNRQVAAELYVSSKAVEYHLRNVYGKLGVTSRSELRERLSS